MFKKGLIAAVLIFVFLVSGCGPKAVNAYESPQDAKNIEQEEEHNQAGYIPPVYEKVIDYNAINANEDGKIMVVMYHGIGNKEEEWVRTADNFRKDLKTLYDKGYRTISLRDYINNNIKVPAGFSPVVITFDDGLLNQFNLLDENGDYKIDADCAVAIMEDFAKAHPDFGNAATFFVYYPVPFRQKESVKYKLEYLINNGFDVGNHSLSHEMLGKMDAEGIQKQLALNVKNTLDLLPGYNVDLLALPYGSRPKDDSLRKYLISGEFEGTSYTNKAVLLVGSNPAPSPADKSFDFTAIPRVRASEMKTEGTGLYDWLKYFDSHPDERYISDGDPDVIAVPQKYEDRVNSEYIKDKKLILY